ncbi:MAG: hypothetical protein HKM99_10045, partial [Flavobacteriaceae bacterium]|nr:hypothetical protein [Flavobacteriaceae bacterium]
MLKFFRRIRHQLLLENKLSKYILYAIGEILLVMIGILLALQVNNWNEKQKLKKEELKILSELKVEVQKSIKELDIVASFNQKSVDRLIGIRDHINDDLPYEKSLDSAFGILDVWNMPYLPFTAYESLKNKGIERISNDSLRSSITEVYEFQMKYLLEDSGRWEWSFNANTT